MRTLIKFKETAKNADDYPVEPEILGDKSFECTAPTFWKMYERPRKK